VFQLQLWVESKRWRVSSLDRIAHLPVGAALTDFSPSRLGVASRCGRAFDFQYIKKLPAPYDKGAMLLGDAVHNGVQAWYELPNEGTAQGYQLHDLAPIVCAQWEFLLPPAVWAMVQRMRDLDAECVALAQYIAIKRPQIKAVVQTKEYQSSQQFKDFSEARGVMLEFCDALDEVKWPKDEDPYKAYKLAAAWADNMQKRWQKLPPPLVVEEGFTIEFEGFRLRGRIDAVRVDPLPPHGLALATVVDYKTGRNPMTPMEAFLQAFIYYKAVEARDDLPTTDRVAFYLTRKDQYQQGRIDPERHARLASMILNGRARQIAMGQFEPSFGFWCKSCDFRDLCERDVSLWSDEYGLVAELMV
jgi:hypothetical protein